MPVLQRSYVSVVISETEVPPAKSLTFSLDWVSILHETDAKNLASRPRWPRAVNIPGGNHI